MELRKAIGRVMKVVPRKKGTERFQKVRMVRKALGRKSALFGTDGVAGAVVLVDAELPDALVAATPLDKAAKDSERLDLLPGGYGNVELRSERSTYTFPGVSDPDFPQIPIVPDSSELYFRVRQWPKVARAFQAATKPREDPELGVVHFTPEFVESFDGARLVRVYEAHPWDGFITSTAFKGLPKVDTALVSATSQLMALWVGDDELRTALWRPGSTYPDTRTAVPLQHPGAHVLAARDQLLGAVKQATEVSKLGLVAVEFSPQVPGVLALRAWQPEDGLADYDSQVQVFHGSSGNPARTLLVNGKYLLAAVKATDTPNVRLGYGGLADPIRLESGPFVACIWPMAYSEGSKR